MKKLKLSLLSFLLIGFQFNNFVKSENLKVNLLITEFLNPNSGPYIETYLNVAGYSVKYQLNEHKLFQASIEVNLIFLQNDSIKAFRKYNLLSPEYKDSTELKQNFIDVQRLPLPKGTYTIELSIKDNNSKAEPMKYTQTVLVEGEISKTSFSSIQIAEKFIKSSQSSVRTKSGYEIIPYVSTYFPEAVKDLNYYCELYFVNKTLADSESYLVTTFLESYEQEIRIDKYYRFQKARANDVRVIMGTYDISELPSGNYNLVVEARDKNNLIIGNQKYLIQRNNPKVEATVAEITALDISNSFVEQIQPLDSLIEFIRCIKPISTRIEGDYANNLIKSKDEKLMKQYFLSFWQRRDGLNPENAWKKYKIQVNYVNSVFKTSIQKGYATDRGRVYLQYGKPDSRLVYDREPSSYPYELWQYYKLNNRSNRRFVFYNPDLVSNNYTLIHSDAIGETIRNDRWQILLQKRNNFVNDFDEEKGKDQFGGNLRDALEISK